MKLQFIQNIQLAYRFKAYGYIITGLGIVLLITNLLLSYTHGAISMGWKLGLLIGLFLIVITKEKQEDEFVERIRFEVTLWALWLLVFMSIINIIISNNHPIEGYKFLLVVMVGYIALFRLKLKRPGKW